MMQLLGYRAWSQHPEGEVLTYDDVEAGADYARHDMRRKIFDTTFKELSKGDVRFLAAMLPDEGPSALADIAQRMDKKSNYASQYKARLIEQGVLAEVGQGNVAIELPLSQSPELSVLGAALVGLVPNCAASVVVAQLYVDGVLVPGAMFAGLLVAAGVGLLVLVRANRPWKQNLAIIAALYVVGVAWGLLVNAFGIVF